VDGFRIRGLKNEELLKSHILMLGELGYFELLEAALNKEIADMLKSYRASDKEFIDYAEERTPLIRWTAQAQAEVKTELEKIQRLTQEHN
jgi:hypothetical protein